MGVNMSTKFFTNKFGVTVELPNMGDGFTWKIAKLYKSSHTYYIQLVGTASNPFWFPLLGKPRTRNIWFTRHIIPGKTLTRENIQKAADDAVKKIRATHPTVPTVKRAPVYSGEYY